jgi:hypothetical protein
LPTAFTPPVPSRGARSPLEIGPHGRHEYDEHVLQGRGNTEHLAGTEENGSYVEVTLAEGRDVLPVFPDQRFDRPDEVLLIQFRHAQPSASVVEPLRVGVGHEHGDLPVPGSIGLHAFEETLPVVEHHSGGVERDSTVVHDPALIPGTASMMSHEHLVRRFNVESQIIPIDFFHRHLM